MSSDTPQVMSMAAIYEESVAVNRDLLQQARARVERMTLEDPLRDKAESLVATIEGNLAESERRLAEARTSKVAGESVDALGANMRRLDTLRREHSAARARYEAELGAEGRYSEQYRAELMQAWDEAQASEAEAAAREAWREYKAAEQAVAADMQVAYRDNEARFDLARIGTLIKDFAAQVQAPPVAQGMESDSAHRLQFIGALLDRAEASGDPDAQRAARIAVAPEVRRMMGTSDSDADRLSRELHHRLGRMAETERGRVVELEGKAGTLRRRGQMLRGSILELEQVATKRSGGMFGVSAWQAAILGESMATFGGGVGDVVEK